MKIIEVGKNRFEILKVSKHHVKIRIQISYLQISQDIFPKNVIKLAEHTGTTKINAGPLAFKRDGFCGVPLLSHHLQVDSYDTNFSLGLETRWEMWISISN